jgi:hypothetical protein
MRQPAYNQIRPFSSGLPCVHGTTTNRTESTRDDPTRLAHSRLANPGQPNATRRPSLRHLTATPQFVSTLSRSGRSDFPPQIKPLRQFYQITTARRTTMPSYGSERQSTPDLLPPPQCDSLERALTLLLQATKQVGPTLVNPREATYRYVLRPFGSSRRPNSTRVDSWRQFGPARLGSVQGDGPAPVGPPHHVSVRLANPAPADPGRCWATGQGKINA